MMTPEMIALFDKEHRKRGIRYAGRCFTALAFSAACSTDVSIRSLFLRTAPRVNVDARQQLHATTLAHNHHQHRNHWFFCVSKLVGCFDHTILFFSGYHR
jgi:hypothetical protein